MRFVLNIILGIVLACCLILETAQAQTQAQDPTPPTPVGKVVWIKGTLLAAMPNKEERTLQRQSIIYLHDTLITDTHSSAQIVFTDNTLMTFKPDTKFYINDYSFHSKAKKGDLGKSVMDLIEGGFRTITGLIAQNNPNNYQINTAIATIGVRGTDYVVAISGKNVLIGFYKGTPCIRGKKSGKSICLNAHTPYVKVDALTQTPVPLAEQPVEFQDKLVIVPASVSFNYPGYKTNSNGVISNFCISQ